MYTIYIYRKRVLALVDTQNSKKMRRNGLMRAKVYQNDFVCLSYPANHLLGSHLLAIQFV